MPPDHGLLQMQRLPNAHDSNRQPGSGPAGASVGAGQRNGAQADQNEEGKGRREFSFKAASFLLSP